jgi:hypothetical protein
MALTAGPRLPCGVELEALVIEVTCGQDPLDPSHQRDCPHCQKALRGIRETWTDLQALTREAIPVPADLTAQIMARVLALG